MIIELGHLALILAFNLSIVQLIVPMIGIKYKWSNLIRLSGPLASFQFLLTFISFGALMNAFITSDFSVKLVVENSHSLKPMLYKISGTWVNHEGSMLLWVMILTLFVLFEKLAYRRPILFRQVTGIFFIGWGILLVV